MTNKLCHQTTAALCFISFKYIKIFSVFAASEDPLCHTINRSEQSDRVPRVRQGRMSGSRILACNSKYYHICCIKKVEELYNPCSEHKGADQLRSYCEGEVVLISTHYLCF